MSVCGRERDQPGTCLGVRRQLFDSLETETGMQDSRCSRLKEIRMGGRIVWAMKSPRALHTRSQERAAMPGQRECAFHVQLSHRHAMVV